ncbi:MAG: hypothetical protein J1F40_05935 [Prevotellaceae bacterium]|nr:hypothetical protein [Prevotellaceae bacterium]
MECRQRQTSIPFTFLSLPSPFLLTAQTFKHMSFCEHPLAMHRLTA